MGIDRWIDGMLVMSELVEPLIIICVGITIGVVIGCFFQMHFPHTFNLTNNIDWGNVTAMFSGKDLILYWR